MPAEAVFIYLAGPMGEDPNKRLENTVHAVSFALSFQKQYAPTNPRVTFFIPHLYHFANDIQHMPREFWLQTDIDWLAKCDALFRIPGFSLGADQEMAAAEKLGLPILHSIDDIAKFLKQFR